MTRDLIALWSFIAMATVTSAQLGSSPEFFTSTPKSRNIDTDPKTNSDLDLRELDEAINDFESLERSDTKFISEKVDFIRSSSNVFDLESLDEVMRKIDNEAKNLGLACPSDTVFIVDNTRSDKTTTDQYTEFIMKVIEGLTISAEVDHVGLLTYNGERLNEAIPLGSINEHSKLIKDIKASNLDYKDYRDGYRREWTILDSESEVHRGLALSLQR
ncbi:hypothetical protein WR25_22026 [Diploscapter pachys]|uniref:VWFA domain-containing protein n=1 Tax=Diploscapter pachys TaxID=2018661 RepID=A0A2A2JR24_9BILA|nr:hypothetical protein WR25_22026 [Diploscapter pachys]